MAVHGEQLVFLDRVKRYSNDNKKLWEEKAVKCRSHSLFFTVVCFWSFSMGQNSIPFIMGEIKRRNKRLSHSFWYRKRKKILDLFWPPKLANFYFLWLHFFHFRNLAKTAIKFQTSRYFWWRKQNCNFILAIFFFKIFFKKKVVCCWFSHISCFDRRGFEDRGVLKWVLFQNKSYF